MIRKLLIRQRFLVTGLIFFILILWAFTNPADNRENYNDALVNRIERNLLQEAAKVQSNEYCLKLKDSLDKIRDWEIARLRGRWSGWFVGFFGVKKINECDSCDSFDRIKYQFRDKYFVELPGYTLKEDS